MAKALRNLQKAAKLIRLFWAPPLNTQLTVKQLVEHLKGAPTKTSNKAA